MFVCLSLGCFSGFAGFSEFFAIWFLIKFLSKKTVKIHYFVLLLIEEVKECSKIYEYMKWRALKKYTQFFTYFDDMDCRFNGLTWKLTIVKPASFVGVEKLGLYNKN